MESKSLKMNILFLCTILFYCFCQIYFFYFGEKIEGFGSDGAFYASWISDYSVLDYFKHHLSSYYVQRILPNIIVHCIMILFHLDLNNSSTLINVFLIYDNCVILMVMCGLFHLARYLKWSSEATYIAFVALFFNYFILKQMPYYAVLTDYTAFAIGFFQIYCYMKKQYLVLLFLAVVGAFVWPTTLLITGLAMFVIRPELFQKGRPNPTSDFYHKHQLRSVLSLAFLLAGLSAMVFYYEREVIANYFVNISGRACFSTTTNRDFFLFPTLFCFYAFYLYFVWPLLREIGLVFINQSNIQKMIPSMLVSLAVLSLVIFFIYQVRNPLIANPSGLGVMLLRPLCPVQLPLKFIQYYCGFFGLGSILFFLVYPKMKFDLLVSANVVCLLFLLIFCFQPEPRQFVTFFPVIPLLLGCYLNNHPVKPSLMTCVIFLIGSFVFSLSWIPHFALSQSLNTLHYVETSQMIFLMKHNAQFLSVITGIVLLFVFFKRIILK